jgi:arylsulfatase A-like enzyme
MIRNVVMVVMDSLRLSAVGAYGDRRWETPSLDRLAARTSRLDRHYTGSLPCMPARHDLATGMHDFLWKPWGSLECWEEGLPTRLRDAGIMTQLVTDHYHLFGRGGENYHHDYVGWEFLRGHEADTWATEPVDSSIGTPTLHARDFIYPRNRARFVTEADYPGPKTMTAAATWLDRNVGRHDRWFLLVDEFDPHEPFDTPDSYRGRYDTGWDGPDLIWPPYSVERLPTAQADHLRGQYGSKVTMIDKWFGVLLDAMDRNGVWDDTVVIVTTDHGLYLGDDDVWGKPSAPIRHPLAHIPTFVHVPGASARPLPALTTAVDLHATVLDAFGVPADPRSTGRSLLPLIDGSVDQVRSWVLGGYFGRPPFVTDGTLAYQPAHVDAPMYVYSNRWSVAQWMDLPNPDRRAELDTWIPGVDVPVIRQPFEPTQQQVGRADRAMLFDLDTDPGETHNLADDRRVAAAARELLAAALTDVAAPAEVLARAGVG